MRFATRWKPIEAWASQHWPVLTAAGYALVFAVVFGGVALAAYHSGFTATEAAVCAALAIFFIRVFARSIPSAQRLIDSLHPPAPDATRKAGRDPGLGGGGVRADRARPRPHHRRAGRDLHLCGDGIVHRLGGRPQSAGLVLAQARRDNGIRDRFRRLRRAARRMARSALAGAARRSAPYSASRCCSAASRFTRGNPA